MQLFPSRFLLREIHLSENKLSQLPGDLLVSVPNLVFLSLGANGLTAFPGGFFRDVAHLQVLQLQNNNLTAFPASLFQTNTALLALWVFSLDGSLNANFRNTDR